jgi:uncharacterized protein
VTSLARHPSLFERLRAEARRRAKSADPAHDFAHVERVMANAAIIAPAEGANIEVVTHAALLHEYVNLPKDHPDSARSGEFCAEAVASLLEREGVDAQLSDAVVACIRVHGFSAGLQPSSMEAAVLQDADRLDAIGAIGIARCFATCAAMGRPFYSPTDPFCDERSTDDKSWGLDHFYRKLLRLPETLNTRKARELATKRTSFLWQFLEQLRSELP